MSIFSIVALLNFLLFAKISSSVVAFGGVLGGGVPLTFPLPVLNRSIDF